LKKETNRAKDTKKAIKEALDEKTALSCKEISKKSGVSLSHVSKVVRQLSEVGEIGCRTRMEEKDNYKGGPTNVEVRCYYLQ